jgi:hypothetical protein
MAVEKLVDVRRLRDNCGRTEDAGRLPYVPMA